MDRAMRLHVVAKIMYYVGWVALICGGLVQLHIATRLFSAVDLSKRNLFEVSVICFVISMASELRTLTATEKELPVAVKRQAAA